MTERDPRWEKVYAYIGPLREITGKEFEMGVDIRLFYEVDVEVQYRGQIFQYTYRVARDMIPLSAVNIVKFALDRCVEEIDKEMDNYETRSWWER